MATLLFNLNPCKPCWAIMFVCLVGYSACAQDRPDMQKLMPKRFIDKVAIIGGPSLVSVWDNQYYKMYGKTQIGYSFGIGLIHSLKNRIELSSLILWERKGQKQVNPLISSSGKIIGNQSLILKYDYITFSFLPQYLIGPKKKFIIGLGGYASHLQKAALILNTASIIGYGNITSESKAFDFGLLFNLGCAVELSEKISLYFQIINNIGLTQTTTTYKSTSGGPNLVDDNGKNNTYTFLVGLKLKRN